MRNGIHFNKLTLINGSQNENNRDENNQDDADDAASYYPYKPQAESQVFVDETVRVQKTFVVFLALSITCAAATLATGSYAAWLSRHQAARQALTDVNDILKSCQTRMSQLEADLQRLPNRQV